MPHHSFHIPVMGTGFTIDTPLKVAHLGIASVISLVDDRLIDRVRLFHCEREGRHAQPIAEGTPDARARRIREYLDLVDRLVRERTEAVRSAPFEPGSTIERYFRLLDPSSPAAAGYRKAAALPEGGDKTRAYEALRSHVAAGATDVNIMTKQDRLYERPGAPATRESSDAMAALRGFAESALEGAVVFSAGLNLHLYGYVEEFGGFYPDERGHVRKKVILKVSDFRSAHIQGKIFAKKGVWVWEYRVESGLNCGGHAFPTEGRLLGPVLEEFRIKREALAAELFPLYRQALEKRGLRAPAAAPAFRVTAQGGIGTSAEHNFLIRHYELDSAGWGSPFLLAPDVTNVDGPTLVKLAALEPGDIRLSDSSPLGIPFYTLDSSASERARLRRIAEGHPGSPCPFGYLAFNTEFGKPLCTASREYQMLKLRALRGAVGPDDPEWERRTAEITGKACICHDLGGGVLIKYDLSGLGRELAPAVCPGPNLVHFSGVTSLDAMADHIYGRVPLAGMKPGRPHCLIQEIKLYIDHLSRVGAGARDTFAKNLSEGIAYYTRLAAQLAEESSEAQAAFLRELDSARAELKSLTGI